MKQLILHLGLHKTGTTSIQASCASNATELAAAGYHYPVFHLGNRNISNHSIPLFSLFTAQPEKYHMNIRWGVNATEANRGYRAQLSELLTTSTGRIIISGEGMSLLSIHELRSLGQFFRSYGYTPMPIACIRSPLDSFTSHVQGSIKIGRTLDGTLEPMDLVGIHRKLRAAFPGLICYRFAEASMHPLGPVGYFLDLIGVPHPDRLELVRQNESLSGPAVRLISYINQRLPLFINGSLNPRRRDGDLRPLWRLGGPRFRLDNTEIDRFSSTLQAQTRYFREHLGFVFDDSLNDTASNPANDAIVKPPRAELEAILPNLDSAIQELVMSYMDDYAEDDDNVHTGTLNQDHAAIDPEYQGH